MVIILVAEDHPDINRTQEFGCNGFIQNSLDYENFCERVEQFLEKN